MTGAITWARMQAEGVRQCGWCMEYRRLAELEEIVLREARAGPGQPALGLSAEWRPERGPSLCWRCRDTLACAAATVARFAGDQR